MKTVLFAILPTLGILSSIAFATWPVWFMERLKPRTRTRLFYKPLFCILFFAGCFGWYSVFNAGIRATLHVDGIFLAEVMTAAVCWLIYLAGIRAEMIAYTHKLERQSERNARH